MFMDDQTTAQIAPVPWGVTVAVQCNNPLLSAQEVQVICTDAGYGPGTENPTATANPNVVIAKRNVEGGPRTYSLHHEQFRFVTGLKGDLGQGWQYDIYGQYSATYYSQEFTNTLNLDKLTNALNVVTDPVTGQPVCAVGAPCVPYNVWKPGGITQDAQNYVRSLGLLNGNTSEQVVSGQVTGNLGQYGAKFPWAHDGVGVALGGEYRRETLDTQPDETFINGTNAGQGGATPAQHGAFDVKELFIESNVPIVQDMPYAKNVAINLGYRFSSYILAGDTNAYQIQGDWAINDYVRIRGGYNRSVRAPNILELFSPQNIQLDGSTDECTYLINPDGSHTPIRFTPQQCLNTGVPLVRYGTLLGNVASQYFGKLGGNPLLKPESSNNYTIGVVFTSQNLIPGALSASMDYFNLKINNVIQTFGADYILDQCAITGQAGFCNAVHRSPTTLSLWQGNGTGPDQGYIDDTLANQGYLATSGIDFALSYKIPFTAVGLPNYGILALTFLGTYTAQYNIESAGTVTDCLGLYGPICQGGSSPMTGPLPTFKSTTRLTWTTQWPGLEFSLNWRYYGPLKLEGGPSTLTDASIGAQSWFDLAAVWHFKDRYTLNVSVNNLFDKDPPLIGSGQQPNRSIANGNTYPGVFDYLGRALSVGLTADF